MATTGSITLGNGSKRQLASLGGRLGARILDWTLIAMVSWLLGRVGVGIASLDVLSVWGVLGMIVMFCVIILSYEVTMIALKGQTVGKMIVGIKVVRGIDGEIPSWGESIKRWLVPQLPVLVPLIGFLLILVVYVSCVFDDRRQGWHDKAAGTFVVTGDRRRIDYPDSGHRRSPSSTLPTHTPWDYSPTPSPRRR